MCNSEIILEKETSLGRKAAEDKIIMIMETCMTGCGDEIRNMGMVSTRIKMVKGVLLFQFPFHVFQF